MLGHCSFSALYPVISSYFVFWDKVSMLPRLAMNLGFSCLSILNSEAYRPALSSPGLGFTLKKNLDSG